jgi:hypothetical protein
VSYDLIFTSERIIADIIKHPEDIPSCQYMSINSLFIGNWLSKRKEQIEQYRISNERRAAIIKLTPDELLKLNIHNFEIKYKDIISVELERGLIETRLKFAIGNAGQKKRQRDFTIKRQHISKTKQLLEKSLKSKIKE